MADTGCRGTTESRGKNLRTPDMSATIDSPYANASVVAENSVSHAAIRLRSNR
jgi:hypothetical protein